MLFVRHTSLGFYMTHEWWRRVEDEDPQKMIEGYRGAYHEKIHVFEILELEPCKPSESDLRLFVRKDYGYSRNKPKYVTPPQSRWKHLVPSPIYGARYDRHYRAYVCHNVYYWMVYMRVTKVHHSDIGRKERS